MSMHPTEHLRHQLALAASQPDPFVQDAAMRLRLTGCWYWRQDTQFRFTEVGEMLRMTGEQSAAWLQLRLWETSHLLVDADWLPLRADLQAHRAFTDFQVELLASGPRAGSLWFAFSGEPVFATDGSFLGFHGYGRDVTVQKRLEMALRGHEKRLRAIFDESPAGIVEWDRQLRVRRWNAAAERIFGWSRDQIAGRHAKVLSRPEMHHLYDDLEKNFTVDVVSRRHVAQNVHKLGHLVPCSWSTSALHDDDGHLIGAISVVENLTERQVSESLIEHMTCHDALTNLPNRAHVLRLIDDDIAEGRLAGRRPLSVLVLNLDRFKQVNDALGHEVGDQMLYALAQRLSEMVPRTCVVGRLSGDQFVVVVRQDGGPRGAHAVAEKLLEELSRPYQLGKHEVGSTVSVGVALYPEDGDSGLTLLHNADAALTHAKSAGRNQFRFFSASLRQAVTARHEVERDLRLALRRGELTLHFQPQVRATDGVMVGAEALLRWNHPVQGPIAPVTFVPIAETADLIVEIGAWVLDEACRTLRQWKDDGVRGVTMAVNLSTHQLRDHALVQWVAASLQRHGLDGQDLELELTESAAMEDPEVTIDVLNRLRELQVQISIDDFGTGYSSLSYLKLLPIHRLKLDQSFVKDIGANPQSDAICAATIALAHKLELDVVAEGVSDEVQRSYLLYHKCDLLQGYLFCKPMAAQEAAGYALAHPVV